MCALTAPRKLHYPGTHSPLLPLSPSRDAFNKHAEKLPRFVKRDRSVEASSQKLEKRAAGVLLVDLSTTANCDSTVVMQLCIVSYLIVVYSNCLYLFTSI